MGVHALTKTFFHAIGIGILFIIMIAVLPACGGGGGGSGGGSSAATDTDHDGTPDASDAFPSDASEQADHDADGVGDNADCNDNDKTIYPGAREICGDTIDQDCSGTDITCEDQAKLDADTDGVTADKDCNDNDKTVYPGAQEICGDAIDQDCSGADIACADQAKIDNDKDGVTADKDCNDNNAAIYPGAKEVCGDTIDQDCNGADLTCVDTDKDGVMSDTDCNDTDATIHPGAEDLCGDSIDQDCSGNETGCINPNDRDGDGSVKSVDCNDNDATVYPDAFDEIADGVDSDCDGVGTTAQPEIIDVAYGVSTNGDGGPAAYARITNGAMALDPVTGILYLQDNSDRSIRKIDTANKIDLVYKHHIYAVDIILGKTGKEFYIAGSSLSRVYKLDLKTNTLTTFAGTGVSGYSGDDGPAIAAQLNSPGGLAMDGAGNIYISDRGNYRIRKVDTAGNITTVAGNGGKGYTGDGGPALSATLGNVVDLVIDTASNTLYLSDSAYSCVRKISAINTTNNPISTYAGKCSTSPGLSGDGGAAQSALLNSPAGLALDAANNLYIADYGNHRIRRVELSTGKITTVAGSVGGYGGDGGAATAAKLLYPTNVLLSSTGTMYIADGNLRIRKVSGGVISNFAGAFANASGPETGAYLNGVEGVLKRTDGSFLLTDYVNNRIMKFSADKKTYGIYAGSGVINWAEGPALLSPIPRPTVLHEDSNGNLYVLAFNNVIVKIDSAQNLTLYLGYDAYDPTVVLNEGPFGDFEIDAGDNLIVSSFYKYKLYKVTPDGDISTIAGTGIAGNSGDGGPATSATLETIHNIGLDGEGNIYLFTYSTVALVRKIDTNGVITTIAGSPNASAPALSDGATATAVKLSSSLGGFAVDQRGNVYLDYTQGTLYKLDTKGVFHLIVDDSGGLAANPALACPQQVHIDQGGTAYIVDPCAPNLVRRIDP